jgi:hypothetical protein
VTLTYHRVVDNWSVTPATAHDHPLIADFLATTRGLSGRKFAADSRDVAEQLDSVFRDGATVVRDEDGKVRGYTALHLPHGPQPEVLADFVFAPGTPPNVVDDLVGSAVARFHDEAETIPDAFLRAFIGADQQSAIDALVRRAPLGRAGSSGHASPSTTRIRRRCRRRRSTGSRGPRSDCALANSAPSRTRS